MAYRLPFAFLFVLIYCAGSSDGTPGAALRLPRGEFVNGSPHLQLAYYSRACATVYFMVPKAASNSLRTLLTRSSKQFKELRPCHYKMTHLMRVTPGALAQHNISAFTFVRDPLERFVALYNYIFPVANHRAEPGDDPADVLCSWGCETQWSGLAEEGPDGRRPAARFPYRAAAGQPPTLAQHRAETTAFVQALERALVHGGMTAPPALEDRDRRHPAARGRAAVRCSDDYQEGTLLNWHWAPQVYFLPWEAAAEAGAGAEAGVSNASGSGAVVSNATYVGRVEEFDAHWAHVWHNVLKVQSPPPESVKVNQVQVAEGEAGAAGASEDLPWKCDFAWGEAKDYCKPVMRREHLDEATVQAVCRMYAADYRAFRYPLPPECRRLDLSAAAPGARPWRGPDYSEADVQCIRRTAAFIKRSDIPLYRTQLTAADRDKPAAGKGGSARNRKAFTKQYLACPDEACRADMRTRLEQRSAAARKTWRGARPPGDGKLMATYKGDPDLQSALRKLPLQGDSRELSSIYEKRAMRRPNGVVNSRHHHRATGR